MPKRNCVAADCGTTSGMGYSLHQYPTHDEGLRRWIISVKHQRKDWDSPLPTSVSCSIEDSHKTEDKKCRNDYGIPAQKRP